MRKYLACLAVALLTLGGLIALLGPRHCTVNKAAFERIEEGMTLAEVDAILGGPAGDYLTRPPNPRRLNVTLLADTHPSVGRDEGTVWVQFDSHFRVIEANFQDAAPYSPGLLEVARWRLAMLGR